MRQAVPMLAVVSPGQGAQAPGMLKSWIEIPAAREALEQFSEAAGIDLIDFGINADADSIRDTAIAQPLLVASALAAYAALEVTPALAAGHSVGEFGAAAVAGVISPADAVSLVRTRGVAMAEAAAAAEATSMAAILGGDADEVAARLAELGLTPANMNGGGQVVAAGSAAAIAALIETPPTRARVIQLQVAGAFHTDYMAPAVPVLAEAAAKVERHEPTITLLSNYDGAAVASAEAALESLVAQVARPVRWDLCMDTMLALGVTGIIELAPGGVLTGLAKRAMKGVPAVALTSPEDLEAARDLARSVA